MFTPVTALRRWFRPDERSVAVNPFRSIAPRPRSRPALLTLEDRLPPGSLLGELIAAALTGAAPPAGSLDRLPAEPFGMARVVQRLRIEGPAEEEAPRPAELTGPGEAEQRNRAGDAPPAPGGVRVAGLDDDLVFLAAPQPVLASAAADGAPGMKSTPSGAESGIAVANRGALGSMATPAGTANPSVPASFLLDPILLEGPTKSTEQPTKDGAKASAPTRVDEAARAGVVKAGGGVSFSHAYMAQLPPNAAPVTKGEPGVMVEDGGSVVIDVLANDTDADGDPLRIDRWDWSLPQGTVFQEPYGKLKFVPAEDFNGTATFQYWVTDGRNTPVAATVTVTVSTDNDLPRAFNDALRFVHAPSVAPLVQYQPGDPAVSVLANDSDVEVIDGVQVGALDTTGLVGTINMNYTTGMFTWSGPGTYAGETGFKYRAVDNNGGLSDWATVKLWSFIAPFPSDTVTANPDRIVIGRDPITASVTANDSGGGGMVAVLSSRVPAKRITEFGFDGTLKYSPSAAPAPISFNYRLFSSNGKGAATGAADLPTPQLTLSNGGEGGTPVPDKNEEDVGAFTVVNQNDTDADGKYDNVDEEGVKAGDGPGVNEMDLMRLTVSRPAGFVAADTLTVTVLAGPAKIFTSDRRIGKGVATLPVTPNDFGADQSKDYWVEIHNTTGGIRGVSIELSYTSQGKTGKDLVKATGVWVNFSTPGGFHTTGKDRAGQADDPTYQQYFDSTGKHEYFSLGRPFGMLFPTVDPAKRVVRLANAMEIEFTATPFGIWKEPNVVFDVSRSVQARSWRQKTTDANPVEIKWVERFFPAFRERANDDPIAQDEDPAPHPDSGNMYQFDFPGIDNPVDVADVNKGDYSGGYKRNVQHMNAQEFVRVKFNGSFAHDITVAPFPTPDTKDNTPPTLTQDLTNKLPYQGSRASELVDWRSWLDFQWNGITWVRTEDAGGKVYNEMTLGPPRNLNDPGF